MKGSDKINLDEDPPVATASVGANIRAAVREEILQLAREGTFTPVVQSPMSMSVHSTQVNDGEIIKNILLYLIMKN